MSNKNNGKENPQSAKVLKLGFNISVSGDPDTDFEILLDDKEKTGSLSASQDEEQIKPLDALEAGNPKIDLTKYEIEKVNTEEVQSTGAIPKQKKSLKNANSSDSLKSCELETENNSVYKDSSIISKIKNTLEQFEKFSDHIKEIPRLRNCPIATSTPFSDKYNYKSESNMIYPEFRPKKYSHVYDFHYRKECFKSYGKPSPPDLFLKPLPAEGYYKRGIYTRYIDLEPYRHYDSDNILSKAECKTVYMKSCCDSEKFDNSYAPLEPLSRILKKPESENGDKQSTSSADSIKDIKIYQSGGILIMQNFKENMDAIEKKEMSEFSAKLIENCNKLKMEVSNFQEDKTAIENFSDENKNLGKVVQFDLSSIEGQKSKSGDSSSNALKDESSSKMESSESISDGMKNKDASPQGTSQSQDFPSFSTQENDSVVSNQPGTSPTCNSSKKLEWDSGADIGYLNLDLTKENLSTIEKIVLKGLSSDGLSEKGDVYEKILEQNQTNRSKFIVERKASDLTVKEIMARSAIKPKDGDDSNGGFIDHKNEKGEAVKQLNAGGIFKGENRFKLEETKCNRNKNSSKEVSPSNRNEIQTGEKRETSDKSINVNTLFQTTSQQTPTQLLQKESVTPSESPLKPRHKKLSKINLPKSKKLSSQRVRTPKKSVNVIGANLLSGALGTFEMGIPRNIHKKVEANPVINDIELSREVDEIIIDQRFKIKAGKEAEALVKDQKEKKSKSRPISASSSSNNTVLPKSVNKEDVKEKTKTSEQKLTDQIIQTSDYDCQSVGVQAFASQVSSDYDFKAVRQPEVMKPSNKETVNTSSKNIQAFGLNASLPKQLEHPKETEIYDNQHTKSTQFFGGSLNSLPNYHSNLVTKPVESCGRAQNILKAKKTAETEIIRLREENEKNILANDASNLAEPKRDSRRHSNKENKENIMSQKSMNSRRSHSNDCHKDSKENYSAKKDQIKAKKNTASVEGSDCQPTSDEISSMVLTSEVLREHGDSIDRNIIQEKYFQSQLVELEKRKMISRSTSMEIQVQVEEEENVKEYMTAACQYSPQSRGTTSGGQYQEPEGGSFKEDPSRSQFGTSKDTNREQNLGAGDSLPSSTQTAHSWVPGVQNICENTTGVGKARSFEYLPGHIYESSGNLREELPSETEQNLITSTSDSDTAKGSASEGGARDSEGRNTLILENSTDNSHDSDRLKILDESLARLNFAVLKLRGKDAKVQSVTKSLLANLWKKMGFEDSLILALSDMAVKEKGKDFVKHVVKSFEMSEEIVRKECDLQVFRPIVVKLLMKRNQDLFKKYVMLKGAANNSDIDPRDNDSPDHEKEANNTLSEISTQELKKDTKEFSIACQTDPKSHSSDSEKFLLQRKALERRINEEKRCQIKWIENEIHHLNILRNLLEKQNSSVQRKKKHSLLTVKLNDDKKEKNHSELIQKQSKTTPKKIGSRAVTPVYGCTISISEKSNTASDENNGPAREQACQPHYGMAVSFSGKSDNWERLVMLPVDVQVSLKDTNLLKDGTSNGRDIQPCSHRKHSSLSDEPDTVQHKQLHSDVCTQYPSPRRLSIKAHTSSQAEFSSSRRSTQCNQDNCLCIHLSGNSSASVCRSSRSKSVEEKNLGKLRFQNEESDPEKRNRMYSTPSPEILGEKYFPVYDSSGKSARKPTEENTRHKQLRSDLGTRYPSPRRLSTEVPTCSQAEFSSPRKSNQCDNDNCTCTNIIGKNSASVSRSSRSKSNEEKGLAKCHVQNEESQKEKRNRICSTLSPEILGEEYSIYDSDDKDIRKFAEESLDLPESCKCKSAQNVNCKPHRISSKSEPSGNGAKHTSVLSKKCKCQNCPKQLLSSDGASQANIHYEKISDDFRCSKIHLQKSSNCACHIIKIHGSRCCSSERNCCSCRSRNDSKKTENQSCQTNCESAQQTEEVSLLQSLLESKRNSGTFAPEKPSSDTNIANQELHPKSAPSSSGIKNTSDHPRHYFLRIEEKEIDELNKPMEQKKSLEVITVTIPVKKAGKSKIYNTDFRQTLDQENSFPNFPPKVCNCCEKCTSTHQEPSREDEDFISSYSKKRAEKPESPTWNPRLLKPYEKNSVEDFCSKEKPREQHYQERNDNGFEQYETKRPSSQKFHCCENCSCKHSNTFSDGNQKEYNSHKRRINIKENYDDGYRFCEDRREPEQQRKTSRYETNWDSGSRNFRGQEFNGETDSCNPEYYNYNKREFMTKSEIRKEEEKKQKVQQPSLQECLSRNRPDFYNSAERRREIISERSKERLKRKNSRMECLIKMLHQCNNKEGCSKGEPKRIFTSVQMREQTLKRYKKLPEVTEKLADQKKKEEYRTNRLMADVFAKKLQIEALKGHINLSNSVSILNTI